jgi:hypothetical protein
VVPRRRTPSDLEEPSPQLLLRWLLIADELKPPGILPPMRREMRPVLYLPSAPLKPLPNAEPSSSRGSSSPFSGAEAIFLVNKVYK